MRPAPGELRTHVCVASAANPVACVAACHTFVCCVASVAHTQESDVFHTADCITATRVRTRTPPEMFKAMHFTQSLRVHKVRTQWTLKIAQSVNTMHIEFTQSVNTVNIEHCTWNNAMPQRVVINVLLHLAV